MQIIVKNLKGDVISLEVNNNDTIENIKLKIKEKHNIESEQISLTLNEKYPNIL